MNGFKTYTGLLITLLGILGLGKIFPSDQVAQIADLILQIGGLIFAWYGRKVAKVSWTAPEPANTQADQSSA